jgi:iron(III) transport system substrate-binding protein
VIRPIHLRLAWKAAKLSWEKTVHKAISVGLVSVLMVLLMAACGSDPTPTPTPRPAAATATPVPQTVTQQLYEEAKAANDGRIHLSFPMTADDAPKILGAFEAKYPGLKVVHTQKTSAEVVEQALLEHQNNKGTVDVLDPGRDTRLMDTGLLSNAKAVFDDLKLPDAVRYGDNLAALYTPLGHGPLYNTDSISEADAPKTWDDMLDPKWKGKIVLEDRLKGFIYLTDLPAYNGRYPGLWPEERIVTFLEGLRALEPLIVHGNTTVGNAVASGERPLAAEVNMASGGRLVQKGAPVAIARVSPHPVEQWLIAAASTGPNPAGGLLLLHWILGNEGVAKRVEFYPSTSVDPASGDIIATEYERLGIELAYTGIEMAGEFSRLQARYREAVGFISN